LVNVLTGKVALVTGGSRGIGRADALALARAGADVVLTDIMLESEEGAEAAEKYGPLNQFMKSAGIVYTEETCREIREMGRRAAAIKMDVTDRDEVGRVFKAVKEEFGSIDILVNNAATLDHVAQIENQSDSFWERDINVNLTGPYNCCKAAWPYMKEKGWGRIVNMASVAGTMGGFGQSSYSSTKAAVIGLTKSLALEGARYNITANAIIGGIIASEAFKMGNPKMNDRIVARTAFKRPGEPEDIANAVVFLASDNAKYITGIELYVSGGIELFTF
jgi:3-oxoacyl-[acyl-carrier protein] reductase